MDALYNMLLNQFQAGKISRRTLIETLAVAVMSVYGAEKVAGSGSELLAAPVTAPVPPPDRPHLKAVLINHISYVCPDYRKARDFYSDLMGMKVVDERPDETNPQYGQCNLVFGTGTKEETPYGAPQGTPLTFLLPRSRNPNPPPSANGGAPRGGPQQQPAPSQVTIDHIGYTIADWDTRKVEEILKARGLKGPGGGPPQPDSPNSFHVIDQHGYRVQICGVGMTAFN
jgi:catechol 2,3-dioxygenase-like lactoylglutathione lyase family enzyme